MACGKVQGRGSGIWIWTFNEALFGSSRGMVLGKIQAAGMGKEVVIIPAHCEVIPAPPLPSPSSPLFQDLPLSSVFPSALPLIPPPSLFHPAHTSLPKAHSANFHIRNCSFMITPAPDDTYPLRACVCACAWRQN